MAGFITKALVASVVLIPCVLAYESWHGKMYLEDMQRNVRAKFPDLASQLQAPEPIPDAENFWKSPHMARFNYLASGPIQQHVPGYGTVEVMHVVIQGLTMDRWNKIGLALKPQSIAEATQQIATALRAEGIDVPVEEAAARQTIADLLTSEDAWQALNAAAASCPSAELYPNLKQREEIIAKSGKIHCVPIPAVSGVFDASRNFAHRAAVATAIGRTDIALQNMEIIQRFAEGSCHRGGSLVELLVGAAVEGILMGGDFSGPNGWHGAEGLPCLVRSGQLTEPQLAKLQNHLHQYDEDAMTLDRGFFREARILSTTAERFEHAVASPSGTDNYVMDSLRGAACSVWLESNMAVMIDGWNQSLVPNTADDDLSELVQTLPSMKKFTQELNHYSPRSILAQIAMPAMSDLGGRILACQTARRQLLVAIGAHRYRLAHGHFPERQEKMVPQFLPAQERDPHAKGKLLSYQRTAEGFEITSLDPKIKFTQPSL